MNNLVFFSLTFEDLDLSLVVKGCFGDSCVVVWNPIFDRSCVEVLFYYVLNMLFIFCNEI